MITVATMSDIKPLFRILDLPVELREEILRYAVKAPNNISPRVSIPRDAFVLRLPALTKTCHLLRKESLPLYFEENTFRFVLKDVLEDLLEQDLRFEKKLLTFGAWCEAVGMELLSRVKRVVISMAHDDVRSKHNATRVLLTMGRFGKVEVELLSLRLDGEGSQWEARPARQGLVRAAKDTIEENPRAGCLLPHGIEQFCTEMVVSCPGSLSYGQNPLEAD